MKIQRNNYLRFPSTSKGEGVFMILIELRNNPNGMLNRTKARFK